MWRPFRPRSQGPSVVSNLWTPAWGPASAVIVLLVQYYSRSFQPHSLSARPRELCKRCLLTASFYSYFLPGPSYNSRDRPVCSYKLVSSMSTVMISEICIGNIVSRGSGALQPRQRNRGHQSQPGLGQCPPRPYADHARLPFLLAQRDRPARPPTPHPSAALDPGQPSCRRREALFST